MLITFFRSIVLYIIVLVVMRLMGKREIGQLQPFELAIAIMIADLASIPMTEIGIPISNGIVPILGLLLMHLIISVINLKSVKAREIICGKPSILIYRGRIDEKVLRKERFTVNELQERLRSSNVVNISDVEYAILETSGQVTVIQKPNKRNTIPEDFNIMPEYEGIPYDLVVDGKIMEDNLQKLGKDYNWLRKEVNKFKINPQDALLVTIDGRGQMFCREKEEKMLKEMAVCVVILISIFTFDFKTQEYTEKTIEDTTSKLETLRQELTKEEKDNDKLCNDIDNIYNEWLGYHEKLAYFIEHDELEKAETDMVALKGSIDVKEYEMAVSELDKSVYVLQHIEDKYKFELVNIF